MPPTNKFALLEAVKAITTDDQPSDADLAWAPIIDDWDLDRIRVVGGDAIVVEGKVAGRGGMPDGARIRTTGVTAIDRASTWVRSRNNLYRLGYRYHTKALIQRVAEQPDWPTAARYLLSQLPEHTLHWGTPELGDWSARDAARDLRAEAESDIRLWETAHGDAADLSNALLGMGRKSAARAARPLMAGTRDRKSAEQVWYELKLTEGVADDDAADILRLAWHALATGNFDAAGFDAHDAIAAAHALAAKANGGAPKDADPDPDDGSGVVVLAKIGGVEGTHRYREIKAASKDIVGKRLPLAPVPADLDGVRAALTAEFPHAGSVIRTLLNDLRGRDHVRFRHTVLTGPPGGGKTRLIRRIGDLIGLPVGRYDAGSSNDGMFGGTPRAWHTGQPAIPIGELLSRRRADVLMHIDELDKAANNPLNGGIVNVLLAMLEGESAARYPDKFFESDVDISHVSFFATVNDHKLLPGPLRDRFRVLHVDEPAIDHLIPLARSIVRDLARASGEDPRFYPELSDGELAAIEGIWRGGSVRRLRTIIEIVVQRRETNPRN